MSFDEPDFAFPRKGDSPPDGANVRAVSWDEHAEREGARYADALARLPHELEARQKQLVRAGMAAGGAGLARLMQGRWTEATGWFVRSAERYRESWEGAPPGSWGRPIGALKSRLLAEDRAGAELDARWTLEQEPAAAGSPIGAYAATLALLLLEDDEGAAAVAVGLLAAADDGEFPRAVAEALAALARSDGAAYAKAVASVLASFEARDDYLEGIPVADTVIVLEALAAPRTLAVRPSSRLLPS